MTKQPACTCGIDPDCTNPDPARPCTNEHHNELHDRADQLAKLNTARTRPQPITFKITVEIDPPSIEEIFRANRSLLAAGIDAYINAVKANYPPMRIVTPKTHAASPPTDTHPPV